MFYKHHALKHFFATTHTSLDFINLTPLKIYFGNVLEFHLIVTVSLKIKHVPYHVEIPKTETGWTAIASPWICSCFSFSDLEIRHGVGILQSWRQITAVEFCINYNRNNMRSQERVIAKYMILCIDSMIDIVIYIYNINMYIHGQNVGSSH